MGYGILLLIFSEDSGKAEGGEKKKEPHIVGEGSGIGPEISEGEMGDRSSGCSEAHREPEHSFSQHFSQIL